jgi:hypothetical protein
MGIEQVMCQLTKSGECAAWGDVMSQSVTRCVGKCRRNAAFGRDYVEARLLSLAREMRCSRRRASLPGGIHGGPEKAFLHKGLDATEPMFMNNAG